jgi:hypothetical protein
MSNSMSIIGLFACLYILLLLSVEQYLCIQYQLHLGRYERRRYKVISSVAVLLLVIVLHIVPLMTNLKDASIDEIWLDSMYDFDTLQMIYVTLFHLNMHAVSLSISASCGH